jgi:peroxiredoxin
MKKEIIMRKFIPVLSVAALAAIVFAAWGQLRASEKVPPAGIGATAPNFSLTDTNAKKVSLADYTGKIVVLEWTNPDCPFVQAHYKAGTMTGLAEKYKDKGVVWVAIDSNESQTPDDNRKWVTENHMPYPMLDDSKSTVARAYGAKSTPDMFIIDKDGKIAYSGAIDNDPDGDKGDKRVNYVSKALDELLAGKPVSTPETKSYGCGVHYAD